MAYYINDIELIKKIKLDLNYITDYINKNTDYQIHITTTKEGTILIQHHFNFGENNHHFNFSNLVMVSDDSICINPMSDKNEINITKELTDYILNYNQYYRNLKLIEITNES